MATRKNFPSRKKARQIRAHEGLLLQIRKGRTTLPAVQKQLEILEERVPELRFRREEG